MGLIENQEADGDNHGYHGGQAHAFELYRAHHDGGAGEAGNHGHCGENQISGFRVIHFLFDEHTDAGSSDEAKEEDAHAAHDGSGDGVDESGNFSNEGEDNGKNGSPCNDPGAVHAGHGHDAHIFTVGGVRRGTDEAGNDIGQAVRKKGPMEAWILNQISSHNIAGHKEMAQVFRENHEYRRQNHHNGGQIEMGRIESGECHPGHFLHMVEIHHPHEHGKDIARNDADEDGDDRNETPSQHRSQDGHNEGKHGNGDGRGRRHALGITDKSRHGHGQRRQLQPDDGHNGTHGSRREQHINPVHPRLLHQKGQENEAEPEGNESPLGIGIGHARRGRHRQHRRNKGKRRAQVSRQLPFADGQIQQRADTIHKKTGGRVHIQQKRNQHRGAEHGKQMLQAQGNGGQNRKPFLHLNNAFTHFHFPPGKKDSEKRKASETAKDPPS